MGNREQYEVDRGYGLGRVRKREEIKWNHQTNECYERQESRAGYDIKNRGRRCKGYDGKRTWVGGWERMISISWWVQKDERNESR